MNLNVLAAVLARANSCPPAQWDATEEFYAIKQEILDRWGTRVGTVQQRITDTCWGYGYYGCDDHCDKCGGTGIYRERYFLLEEWSLSGFSFHRPLRRIDKAHAKPVSEIEGRISHGNSLGARQCWLALFCIFRPSVSVFRDSFISGSPYSPWLFRRVMRIVGAIGVVPTPPLPPDPPF